MPGLFAQLRRDYEVHDSHLLHLGLWAVWTYHYGRWSLQLGQPWRWFTSKLYGLLLLMVDLTSGCQIQRECEIGEDLHVIHSGNIKIGPKVRIGDRCGLMQDVVLGTTIDKPGTPVLGDDVFIGPGAKVLGPVTIGDGVRIGANSVVLTDVPAGTTAIGVPARVLKFRKNKEEGAEPETS